MKVKTVIGIRPYASPGAISVKLRQVSGVAV